MVDCTSGAKLPYLVVKMISRRNTFEFSLFEEVAVTAHVAHTDTHVSREPMTR